MRDIQRKCLKGVELPPTHSKLKNIFARSSQSWNSWDGYRPTANLIGAGSDYISMFSYILFGVENLSQQSDLPTSLIFSLKSPLHKSLTFGGEQYPTQVSSIKCNPLPSLSSHCSFSHPISRFILNLCVPTLSSSYNLSCPKSYSPVLGLHVFQTFRKLWSHFIFC